MKIQALNLFGKSSPRRNRRAQTDYFNPPAAPAAQDQAFETEDGKIVLDENGNALFAE